MGSEVFVDRETWKRIELRGDTHLFHRRVPLDVGAGPANKIAILFNSHQDNRANGIGDYIHAMPTLTEKAKSFDVDVWSSEFFRPALIPTGVNYRDSSDLYLGVIQELKKEYSEVHSLIHWCIIHDEETEGAVTIDRFEQLGNFINQPLPESYSWREAFGITKQFNPNGPVGIGLQSTSPQRSYARMQEVAELIPGSIIFGGGNAHREQWMQTAKSLPELIEQLLCCSLVVAVDNGILALCLALEIPVLAVFGPTEEKIIVHQFSRYVDMRNVRVLRSQREDVCCRPCSFQMDRGWGVDLKCRRDGTADCLLELSPRAIVDAANKLLHELC